MTKNRFFLNKLIKSGWKVSSFVLYEKWHGKEQIPFDMLNGAFDLWWFQMNLFETKTCTYPM